MVQNILSRTFVTEISRVFNRRVADNNSSINIEECNTSVLHNINKMGDCNKLKSLCAKVISINLFLLI